MHKILRSLWRLRRALKASFGTEKGQPLVANCHPGTANHHNSLKLVNTKSGLT